MAGKKAIKDEFLEAAEDAVVAPTPESHHESDYMITERKRKGLVKQYRDEKKVGISISPFYAPYLGKVIRQVVNGVIVDIPADGQTYQVNETHASHIMAKIKRVDAMIARQQKAGDVQNNFEYSPGQLHI